MGRFYQFVKALRRYSRKQGWRPRLREKIHSAVISEHPDFDPSAANEMADFFSALANNILDCASTPFPDPLVEMRNPHQVEQWLSSTQRVAEGGILRPVYTDHQIDEILRKTFGKDWKWQSKRVPRT
jgi:hypothetical protein